MFVRPCVRACVRPGISWELEHRFFLIFCMELGDHNWRKVTNLDFLRKIWFSQNLGKCGEKCDFWWFFAFYEKSNHGLGIQTMFKQKILWYSTFWCKPHVQEKSGSHKIWENVAKVPKLVGILKQLYLRNRWSKSKSVWIFKETKDSSFFHVKTVFPYFGSFTRQITFKVLPKKVVKSAIFGGFWILWKISSLLSSRYTLKSCRLIAGMIQWKLHAQENSDSGVRDLGIWEKVVKNLIFVVFSNFTKNVAIKFFCK